MQSGMTASTKIAISLPAPLVAKAQRAVKHGEATSVSAYIARAVEERATNEDLARMLEEMLAESGGPMTNAERRQADIDLGLLPQTTKTKKKAKRRGA